MGSCGQGCWSAAASQAGALAGSVRTAGKSRGSSRSLQVLGDQVGFIVLRQMVAPHEAFLALCALESLVTCGGTAATVRGWQTVCHSPGSTVTHLLLSLYSPKPPRVAGTPGPLCNRSTPAPSHDTSVTTITWRPQRQQRPPPKILQSLPVTQSNHKDNLRWPKIIPALG